MKEQIRVAAMIIKNKKLLLVKGSDKHQEFWTPGGKREEGESDLECLTRELNEEINATVTSAKFLGEYTGKSLYHEDVITVSRVYLVGISGEIKVAHEIQGYVWMTKKEFETGKYPLIAVTRDEIIPDLIKRGLF